MVLNFQLHQLMPYFSELGILEVCGFLQICALNGSRSDSQMVSKAFICLASFFYNPVLSDVIPFAFEYWLMNPLAFLLA